MERETSREYVAAARALLAPRRGLQLPVPAYQGRSLPNATSTVVRALGKEVEDDPRLLPPLEDDLDPFQGRRAEGPIVLFLIDGLGGVERQGQGLAPPSDLPTTWEDRIRPITSVFPTTTTVALTSLSTAEPPALHGIVGHRVYLPLFGNVTEILRMAPTGVGRTDDLAKRDWVPSMVSGVPSIFRRGVPGMALSRAEFQGSAFTRLLYDGAEYTPFHTAADCAHELARLLGQRRPPRLVFAYWDELDAVEHLHGPRSEFSSFEAGQVDRILRAAARQLDHRTADRVTVLLTSDHGQVTTTRSAEVAIHRAPEVVRHLLRPPGGDRRVGFFAARPGHVEALRHALTDCLPPGHRILEVSRAIEGGLFGPPPFHPELETRLGDLLAFLPSPSALAYRIPGAPEKLEHRVGAHGGLEPPELVVPLVAGRLAELTASPSHRP
jgi:hypothetical protein